MKQHRLPAALSALALSACLVSCGGGRPAHPRPMVVLLGIDGADWTLIDPLIARGRLPLFKELKERSAWGSLRTITPAKSPIIWTTIASGRPMSEHGIDDFRSRRPNRKGKFPIYNGLDIRVPLLWDMLASRNRRSVLVNWYLSYPPQPFNGVNVSDYFADSVISDSRDRDRHISESVFPPGLAAGLARGIDSDYRRALERTGIPDYPARHERMGKTEHYSDLPVFKEFPGMVRKEEVVAGTAARLFRSEEFDLFSAYYKLPDEIQHIAFMALVDEEFKRGLDRAAAGGRLPDTLANEARERIADIVCPVYRYVESVLRGYFEAPRARDAYFIIVSDHGFSFFVRDGTVRYNHVGPEKAPDGILVIRGPGVKPGKIKLARVYDIAPTVLYLLGLPLDRGMDGQPLRRLFPARPAAGHTVYRKGKATSRPGDSEAEERKLEELKALGYIN